MYGDNSLFEWTSWILRQLPSFLLGARSVRKTENIYIYMYFFFRTEVYDDAFEGKSEKNFFGIFEKNVEMRWYFYTEPSNKFQSIESISHMWSIRNEICDSNVTERFECEVCDEMMLFATHKIPLIFIFFPRFSNIFIFPPISFHSIAN